MRTRLIGVICLGLLCVPLPEASAQPTPPEPIRISESESVTVNGARFVVVAETQWKQRSPRRDEVIAIQLRITNISKADLVFSTFDPFSASNADYDTIDRGVV